MTRRFGRPPVEGITALGIKLEKFDDPGDAGAIPVNRSGYCHFTTAAAETRTIGLPAWAGQLIMLVSKSIAAGNCVITASAAINVTGNTTITLNTTNDTVLLMGMEVAAGTLAWRVIVNDGATLG